MSQFEIHFPGRGPADRFSNWLIFKLVKKGRLLTSHRSTTYSCCLPALGGFSRSWSCKTCRRKDTEAKPRITQITRIFWATNGTEGSHELHESHEWEHRSCDDAHGWQLRMARKAATNCTNHTKGTRSCDDAQGWY